MNKLSVVISCYNEKQTIAETRFGIEPEITAKLAHMKAKLRLIKVPVSYVNRSDAEGKQIGWKDAVSAIRCILKFNLLR